MIGLLALNSLKQVDIIFIIALGAIIALCVIIYFLIPVFNKKQYREQRENLKKREVAFKSNIRRTDGSPAAEEVSEEKEAEVEAEPLPEEVTAGQAEPIEHEEK